MKSKRWFIPAFVALVLLVGSVGVQAITNGQADGDDHPYVGLLVFDAEGGPAWQCTGTLIAPDVVLTAGHCTDGAIAARIWFEEEVDGETGFPFTGASSYDGVPLTHPDYQSDKIPRGGGNGLPALSYRDVGIVVLTETVPSEVVATYAQLPGVGLVDTLKNKTHVDLVGYGAQSQIRGRETRPWTGLLVRLYAPSQIVSGKFVHAAEYMRLSMNAGGGRGGTCFGDSGGPDLLGGTDTVLAVSSYVINVNCTGVGYSSRVDVPEVLEWIEGFLD